MNDPLRELYGLPSDQGVLVVSVEGYSPAKQAGLQAGDVIIQLEVVPEERRRSSI